MKNIHIFKKCFLSRVIREDQYHSLVYVVKVERWRVEEEGEPEQGGICRRGPERPRPAKQTEAGAATRGSVFSGVCAKIFLKSMRGERRKKRTDKKSERTKLFSMN